MHLTTQHAQQRKQLTDRLALIRGVEQPIELAGRGAHQADDLTLTEPARLDRTLRFQCQVVKEKVLQVGGVAVVIQHGIENAPARLRVRNTILRQSQNHGLYTRGEGVELEQFDNNTLTANGATPAYISAKHVVMMQPSSTFTGNMNDRLSVYVSNQRLASNATWEDLGVPYWMVEPNATFLVLDRSLTLKPGVEMEFAPASGFAIREGSSFNAIGTETDPIVLSGWRQMEGNGLQRVQWPAELL